MEEKRLRKREEKEKGEGERRRKSGRRIWRKRQRCTVKREEEKTEWG